MSHWFTNAEDRYGPWHWNGIAISLCHTAGLHRLPSCNRQDVPDVKPLWRRLWWSVYCREVWLSQAQGRPMRIRPDDVDTAMPTAHDIGGHATTPQAAKYLPTGMIDLLRGWIDFVHMSACLGKVLLMNYRVNKPEPTASEIEQAEAEIRTCYTSELIGNPATGSTVHRLHAYQLRLYFQYKYLSDSFLSGC